MSAPWWKNTRTIAAIGRNYRAHAAELNNPVPKEPFFFLKPVGCILPTGGTIELPRGIIANHEVELAVVIGRKARSVPSQEAMSYVKGYCLAIDMTARNMQDVVKAKGLPWSAVKGFDTFQPTSSFVPVGQVRDAHDLMLEFQIDGQVKQHGTTGNMIFDIPRLIEHVTSIMTLDEDDMILTGTPEGVGPVKAGNKIVATLSQGTEELARWEGDVKDRTDGYAFST